MLELLCLPGLSAAAVCLQEELQHIASLASAHQRRADLILEAAEANVAQFEQVGTCLLSTNKHGSMSPATCHLSWGSLAVAPHRAWSVRAWSMACCGAAWLADHAV